MSESVGKSEAKDAVEAAKTAVKGEPNALGGRGRVTIWQHAHFQGQALTFEEDVPDLVARNFNDVISSIEVHEGEWEFFEDVGYGGRSWRLKPGKYPWVVDAGLPNDRISSLRRVAAPLPAPVRGVPAKPRITIWEAARFGGKSATLTDAVPDLRASGWNDIVSSIEVHEGEWELFEHIDHGGRSWRLKPGKYPWIPDVGVPNDVISSLRPVAAALPTAPQLPTPTLPLPAKPRVTIWEHGRFQGKSATLTDAVPDLRVGGLNDMLSSVEVHEGEWELSEHLNHTGRSWRLKLGKYQWLPDLGIPDNVITSIRPVAATTPVVPLPVPTPALPLPVPTPARPRVTIWEHGKFQGKSATLTDAVPDLRVGGLNDMLSSVEVHEGEWELSEHLNHTGRSWRLKPGKYPWLPDLGIPDNVITSIRPVAATTPVVPLPVPTPGPVPTPPSLPLPVPAPSPPVAPLPLPVPRPPAPPKAPPIAAPALPSLPEVPDTPVDDALEKGSPLVEVLLPAATAAIGAAARLTLGPAGAAIIAPATEAFARAIKTRAREQAAKARAVAPGAGAPLPQPLPTPAVAEQDDLLLYDARGEAEFLAASADGRLTPVGRLGRRWRRGWDLAVAGDFGGRRGTTDVLWYDRQRGMAWWYSHDAERGHRLLRPPETGWRRTWTHIVAGDFGSRSGRTDLLFYDARAGEARFFATGERGGKTGLRPIGPRMTRWRRTWTHIVPGNFGGAGRTDLLLYDAVHGEAWLFEPNQRGGLRRIGAPRSGMRKTWSHVVAGDFGGGTGRSDLLFYDASTGDAEFWVVEAGGVLRRAGLPQHGWRRSWTRLVVGRFGSLLPTQDVLFYDARAGEAWIYNLDVSRPPLLVGQPQTDWRSTWGLVLAGRFTPPPALADAADGLDDALDAMDASGLTPGAAPLALDDVGLDTLVAEPVDDETPAGTRVAIRCVTNGKYLRVGGEPGHPWRVTASADEPTDPDAQFELLRMTDAKGRAWVGFRSVKTKTNLQMLPAQHHYALRAFGRNFAAHGHVWEHFRIEGEHLYCQSTGGYVNYRGAPGGPVQHVRGHGNARPWRPAGRLDTARFVVERVSAPLPIPVAPGEVAEVGDDLDDFLADLAPPDADLPVPEAPALPVDPPTAPLPVPKVPVGAPERLVLRAVGGTPVRVAEGGVLRLPVREVPIVGPAPLPDAPDGPDAALPPPVDDADEDLVGEASELVDDPGEIVDDLTDAGASLSKEVLQ